MPYPPLYPFSRRYFDLPTNEADDYFDPSKNRAGPPVPVFLLVRKTKEERSDILEELKRGSENEVWPENITPRPLGIVPWLRNYTPSTDVLFEIVKGSAGTHIFVDDEGFENRTCVITHWVHFPGELNSDGKDYWQEFARVGMNEARRLVSIVGKEKSWFPDIIPETCKLVRPETVVGDTGIQDLDVDDQGEEKQYAWPDHILKDLRLKEEEPTILSMINLSEDEIKEIKNKIGPKDDMEVNIINWPASTSPASDEDIWRIFERIKPDWPSPCGEIYFFTIDTWYLSPTERRPEILMYSRKCIDPPVAHVRSSTSLEVENLLHGDAIKPSMFFIAWETAFQPETWGSTSSVRQNNKMRTLDLGLDHIPGVANPWYNGKVVANPDVPIIFEQMPVFLLGEVTNVQEHWLRDFFNGDYTPNFVRVPARYADDTMKGLMKWLQSPGYMRYQESPPYNFLAVDEFTLSQLEAHYEGASEGADEDEKPSVLVATHGFMRHVSEGGHQLAKDDVGYVVGRCVVRESFDLLEWNGFVASAMGLMYVILDNAATDQTGSGRFYWDCFDTGDEEFEGLVVTME